MITIISKRDSVSPKGQPCYIYLCSDGVERFLPELVKISNTSLATIEKRIQRYGLTHKKILYGYVKPGYSLLGKIKRSRQAQRGNSAWQALSD